MNYESLLDDVLALADKAGDKVMDIYETDFKVETKEDNSPITEADIASHHVIVDGLKELTPDIPILSEESANAPWDERRNWTRFWLVDPIDGTKEFTNRTGEFTVNIALIENGKPVMGVVTAPALAEAFYGIVGKGAWKRKSDGSTEKLEVVAPPKAVRAVASKSHMNEETRDFLNSLGDHELVQAGSSLKFCRIAEGKADIYPRIGPTCEWDTGAAHAVLLAAGGKVNKLDGTPLTYGKEDVLNPHFVASGDWY
ncbi:3'(2'),5'-bisphosphate nucleotidase [Marinobacter daqiaonensis]|uniref:3'(2'),5'-bisphosphate nucleotidase CysQ n=1 Tax=Marinobacter daqiaonensis TaxID=650891 RepID=A0A1I6HA62_9GAMM|nr:3'(2'),5'-bisphosphate nucleotidase CysQ [Marinobacter daqiaonensis]SFR51395.1 3'(2'),5'-bisphosphate nucleotidase [Marinobacter daqiaonensis]